jgi:hypothetical protein
MLKSLMKFLQDNQKTILFVFLALAVIFLLMNYNESKSIVQPEANTGMRSLDSAHAMPMSTSGDDSYQKVGGGGNDASGLPQASSSLDASELLPKDTNSDFSSVFPNGKEAMEGVNFLKAGHHVGINTVGSTLRNANLQLRSEPPNPRGNIGPFNQSTIEPDSLRASFELEK